LSQIKEERWWVNRGKGAQNDAIKELRQKFTNCLSRKLHKCWEFKEADDGSDVYPRLQVALLSPSVARSLEVDLRCVRNAGEPPIRLLKDFQYIPIDDWPDKGSSLKDDLKQIAERFEAQLQGNPNYSNTVCQMLFDNQVPVATGVIPVGKLPGSAVLPLPWAELWSYFGEYGSSCVIMYKPNAGGPRKRVISLGRCGYPDPDMGPNVLVQHKRWQNSQADEPEDYVPEIADPVLEKCQAINVYITELRRAPLSINWRVAVSEPKKEVKP
jgi:hypothetical protein